MLNLFILGSFFALVVNIPAPNYAKCGFLFYDPKVVSYDYFFSDVKSLKVYACQITNTTFHESQN